MIRSELVKNIAGLNPHITLLEAEGVVDLVFNEISQALIRGQRVELHGFGSFTTKKKNPRVGRNPKTGESVKVDFKTVHAFKSGRTFQKRLNASL